VRIVGFRFALPNWGIKIELNIKDMIATLYTSKASNQKVPVGLLSTDKLSEGLS